MRTSKSATNFPLREKKYSHIYVPLLDAFKVAPFFHSMRVSLSRRRLCDSPLSKYYEGESPY